jgi:hypothetical protein
VKRRNVEARYRMEYLHLSFLPTVKKNTQRFSQVPDLMSFNYLLLLYDLLPYYQAYSPERYDWLKSLFTDIIVGLTRQGHLGVGIHNSVFVIKEVTEGGLHYELVEDPTLFDEFSRKAHNIKDDAAPRVLFKTDLVK